MKVAALKNGNDDLAAADLSFRTKWAVESAKYKEAKALKPSAASTAAIGKMNKAFDDCASASRAYEFATAERHLAALKLAIAEVLVKKSEDETARSHYWTAYFAMKKACPFEEVKKAGEDIKATTGGPLGASDAGLKLKALLDADAAHNSSYRCSTSMPRPPPPPPRSGRSPSPPRLRSRRSRPMP